MKVIKMTRFVVILFGFFSVSSAFSESMDEKLHSQVMNKVMLDHQQDLKNKVVPRSGSVGQTIVYRPQQVQEAQHRKVVKTTSKF